MTSMNADVAMCLLLVNCLLTPSPCQLLYIKGNIMSMLCSQIVPLPLCNNNVKPLKKQCPCHGETSTYIFILYTTRKKQGSVIFCNWN